MSTLSFNAQQWPREGTPFANATNALELAALVMTNAQEQFARRGSHPTVLLLLTEDTVHLIHTPLSEKENERVAVGNMTLKLAHDYDALGVALVSEAWLFPGIAEDSIGDPSRLLHRDDKVEVLLVRASWNEDDTAAKALQIVRESGKDPKLIERPDLFTADGVDGLLLLKKKAEGSVSKQVIHRPIPV